MKNAFSVLILLLWIDCTLHAQNFAENRKFALVVGVSDCQDSLIASNPQTRQRAELFAAFLRTRSGGMLPSHRIHLLTAEDATLSQASSGWSWIWEEALPGDEVVLYFSGPSRMVTTDQHTVPHLYFHDSPSFPATAGSYALPEVFNQAAKNAREKSLVLTIALELDIYPPESAQNVAWQEWRRALEASLPVNWSAHEKRGRNPLSDAAYTRSLTDALMGYADRDADGWVSAQELKSMMREEIRRKQPATWFYWGSTNDRNSLSQSLTERELNLGRNSEVSVALGAENNRRVDSLLGLAGDSLKKVYYDFLLTIRLGHLLEPAGRCASDLYEQLSREPAIAYMHSSLRRRLAAALQDEAQQALNAYLKTDTRELQRRTKNLDNYRLYERYYERCIELTGKENMFYPVMRTKQLYFAGLVRRLEANRKKNDSLLLREALHLELQAMQIEPDAAYVLNEIGVNYHLLAHDSAYWYYQKARENSPMWGIPCFNLSLFFEQRGRPDSALYFAREAARVSPWNDLILNRLGEMYHKTERYQDAIAAYTQSLAINPSQPDPCFQLSCLYALLDDLDQATFWLHMAVNKGFDDKQAVSSAPDLASLRNSGRIDQILDIFKEFD